jgi:peptidoglycan/LPS O-acetylase OafA/YrhL
MIKYFKGLDTLRAIAALVVVFGHIELLKNGKSIPNLVENDFILFPSGHIAVILFFVLSGFLITYLLVKEKEKTGRISFRKFYMRRILRIWPLYYTIILLSYWLINSEYGFKTILLCLSIFPNIAHALGSGWPSSPQIWSIGVEEQFYLFWPLVLFVLPERKVITGLLIFFVGYSIFPHLFGFINVRTFQNEEVGLVLNKIFYGTKFNCMAIGALMGFAMAKKKNWIKILSKDIVAIFSIILSFSLWFFRFEMKHFTDELFSIIFAVMIVGVVSSKKINIDTRITRFLGKISYGIYMYHWIIILIVLKYLKYDGNNLIFNLELYIIVIGLTILLSWISYITLERFFLNVKKRYETK